MESRIAKELYISVDVEGTGVPGWGSLLSIGACVVGDTNRRFYVELKPIVDMPWDESAERVHGLSYRHLQESGQQPGDAMLELESWVQAQAAEAAQRPVFVSFGTYDWMFVGAYLERFGSGYAGLFGPNSLDMKSYYAGMRACSWGNTRKSRMPARLKTERKHTHNALDDAIEQAEMFELWLKEQEANHTAAITWGRDSVLALIEEYGSLEAALVSAEPWERIKKELNLG